MKKFILFIFFVIFFSSTFACDIISTKWNYIKMTPDCLINQVFIKKIDKFDAAKYLFENKLIELSVPNFEEVYSWNNLQIIDSYPVWYIQKFEFDKTWLLDLLDWKYNDKYKDILIKATNLWKIVTINKKYIYGYIVSKVDFYQSYWLIDDENIVLYKIPGYKKIKLNINKDCIAYIPFLHKNSWFIENTWKYDIWLFVSWNNCYWAIDTDNTKIDILDLWEFIYWKKWYYVKVFKKYWDIIFKETLDETWKIYDFNIVK